MRIVFMGTPDFAVPTLMEIIGQGHEVVACYSQPPRKSGRGMALQPSPVHEKAEQFGIPVFNPMSFKDDTTVDTFVGHNADVAVVVAYGMLLPESILTAPTHGCLNLHASLLPRWRGAAPINRAIMEGDKETGVMVMRMEKGLDTGPIAMVEKLTIGGTMTAGDLHDQLIVLWADLTVRALGGLERSGLSFQPQEDGDALYAKKISKEESRIDWTLSAEQVHNKIRGLSPFPGAWTEMTLGDKAHRVKIVRSSLKEGLNGKPGELLEDGLTIACGSSAVRLESLQRSGKSVMNSDEFLRGNKLVAGSVLS